MEEKEIIIVINDSINAFHQYQATGAMPTIRRRIIELELTKDQLSQLGIKEGEEIESISFKTLK